MLSCCSEPGHGTRTRPYHDVGVLHPVGGGYGCPMGGAPNDGTSSILSSGATQVGHREPADRRTAATAVLVSVDAAFFATLDPVTLLFTSARSEEPLIEAAPQFMDNDLAQRTSTASSTSPPPMTRSGRWKVTRGERRPAAASPRSWRPSGWATSASRCCGPAGAAGECSACTAGALRRAQRTGSGLLRGVAPHVAEGLRRAQLLEVLAQPRRSRSRSSYRYRHRDPGRRLRMTSINAAAEHWISEIADLDWPATMELPMALYSAAARLNQIDDGLDSASAPADLRIRTAAGRWLVVRATRLDGAGRAADRDPPRAGVAGASEVGPAGRARAHARPGASRRLWFCRGTTPARWSTPFTCRDYTVQEHLKSIFDKFGVRSRRELVDRGARPAVTAPTVG